MGLKGSSQLDGVRRNSTAVCSLPTRCLRLAGLQPNDSLRHPPTALLPTRLSPLPPLLPSTMSRRPANSCSTAQPHCHHHCSATRPPAFPAGFELLSPLRLRCCHSAAPPPSLPSVSPPSSTPPPPASPTSLRLPLPLCPHWRHHRLRLPILHLWHHLCRCCLRHHHCHPAASPPVDLQLVAPPSPSFATAPLLL